MNKEVESWINEDGTLVLRDVGIKKGQKIFDCCCGEGNYTLPAARIVGEKGCVYALDMNKEKLDTLNKRFNAENLNNIITINEKLESNVPLDDESIDTVLLYDIFWYFSLENESLSRLLSEVYRISKDGALISVYPEHIDTKKLKEKIENSNFRFEGELHKTLVHDSSLTRGHILNFRKVMPN